MKADVPAGACAWQGQDLLLAVYLQPRAGRDEIVGWHGQALKVRITAPPVDGKANAHLCRYLARRFAVPRAHVELLRGHGSRQKSVRIQAPASLPPMIPPPPEI